MVGNVKPAKRGNQTGQSEATVKLLPFQRRQHSRMSQQFKQLGRGALTAISAAVAGAATPDATANHGQKGFFIAFLRLRRFLTYLQR
jgi:hypothetical protein